MSRAKHTERAAEVVAALMKQPRTVHELAAVVGVDELSGATMCGLRRWVQEFHRAGVVYVKGYRRRFTKGPRAPVYALQPAVFANQDASREVAA